MNVRLTSEAIQQLDQLPPVIHARVLSLLARLANRPTVSGAKPLRGNLAGCYRLRTGDYRVQFRVSEKAVIVEKIGHRDRFYED
jgi:mRNA-degrading endonuclease RelE of RelBE toxin-antitoxin system